MNCPNCHKDTLRPHTYSDGNRRWVTTRCAECGWVDTTSWIEKRPPVKERRGKVTGLGLNSPVPVRILVVDDAATIRDVCAELIRDLGYEVNVVADAAEALVRLREERFHAVSPTS